MPVNTVRPLVYIVEWSDPDPPYCGGIAGIFATRDEAKALVDRFKFNHARVIEWPLGFGDLPHAENQHYQTA